MFELIENPISPLVEVQPGSFIYEYRNNLDPDDCAEIIQQFEQHEEEQRVGTVAWGVERPELKRSTDLYMRGEPHWAWADNVFFLGLQKAIDELSKIHTIFHEDDIEDNGYQIQRTLPGQFYHWHKDANFHSRKRIVVVIWYLNDMPDGHGGETEFLHQGVKIQPEVGKLIFFPPYWTHIHRGREVVEGAKYIACTWISYAGANDFYGCTVTDDGIISPK